MYYIRTANYKIMIFFILYTTKFVILFLINKLMKLFFHASKIVNLVSKWRQIMNQLKNVIPYFACYIHLFGGEKKYYNY